MRMSRALVLNVIFVFGLMLPSQFFIESSTTSAKSEAQVVPPASGVSAANVEDLASNRANRKQERREDHRKNRKQDQAQVERKQDHKQKQRKQDRKRAKQEREQGRVGDWQEFCAGPGSIQLAPIDLCTHGADPVPVGFDIDEPVDLLSPEVAEQQIASMLCDGDGQSGFRVQLLYVHASDVPSRYLQKRASIQGWAGEADQIFQRSAAETGGSRAMRFTHDASCQPTVQEVEVSPAGDNTFAATISELSSQGYNRTDRIYLAFVDATVFCGVGTLWNDDRPTSDNWNYSGPSYSRVDAGCWSGKTAAHEVMHNLGGVQPSAPNASGWFHCIDEYDVMCYPDTGSSQAKMRVDCPDVLHNTMRFDCGHDDYYHTNPAPGSYLATHWNPANNRFLINAVPPPAPPPPLAAPVVEDTTAEPDKNKNIKNKSKNEKKHKNKGNKKKH